MYYIHRSVYSIGYFTSQFTISTLLCQVNHNLDVLLKFSSLFDIFQSFLINTRNNLIFIIISIIFAMTKITFQNDRSIIIFNHLLPFLVVFASSLVLNHAMITRQFSTKLQDII